MTTNAAEVSIRRAVEADRETLIELIIRGFEDVTVHRWREQRYGVIGGRTWDEWKADDMRQIDISLVVIAEVDGEAVGFATYHLNKVTSIGTVGNNAVMPAYRGCGIGGKLHACVLELIEEAGMEFAQVSTGLDDLYEPARRMYERQGFKPLYRSVLYMKRVKRGRLASAAMEYKILWGDIHNHNTVGLFHYTKGTLERAIDMAQSHLDFFAFTGHAQWHDIPEMPNNVHEQWQEGFDRHAEIWPKTKQLIKDANQPGQFESFLGYEWHSAAFGDHCVIYKEDGPLQFADHVRKIQEHARRSGALLVPHHPGYMRGFRGANWDYLDETVSPIVEIISEHGGAERDRGPFAYTRHGLGPRVTINTLQHALSLGHHVGVTGSSDDHHAHPGAYNEGTVAVLVPEFSREAIWDALWSRRCYAVTGDKIELDFRINGQPMGSRLTAAAERKIDINVRGWDEIEKVEVIKNNRVIHRNFPADAEPQEGYPWSQRHRCRIEVGWGPWSAFGKPRTAEWDLTATVDGARIHQAMPCFQSGPFHEENRSRILESTATRCRFQTYTSRADCLNDSPQNAVVLDVEGPPSATVTLAFTKPMQRTETYTLEEVAQNAVTDLTTGFPSDSFLIHRLVPDELARASYDFADSPSTDRAEDFYYLRVTQENGQVAWSSPIWVANS